MGSIDIVKAEVDRLYTSENAERAPLATWLYKNHVYQVADESARIARRFGGDPDVSYAAGLLHDVADAVLPRQDPSHTARSTEIARDILAKAGFHAEEVAVVVDDALRYHSCHGGDHPHTPEGKALSTGDAIAHLTTDFYPYISEASDFRKRHSPQEVSHWVAEKIERDFHKKIAYDEVRAQMKDAYERLKKQLNV